MSLVIAANWKMNKTVQETKEYVEKLKTWQNEISGTQVIICPPYTALQAAAESLNNTSFALGCQNMHWENSGAFTGEISPLMLKELGVRYVILGHSERRHIMGETDAEVNKKIKVACEYNFIPIFCVGETLEQREAGQTNAVVLEQLREGLKDIEADKLKNLIVAYEPVWAIGTGKAATSADAIEVCKLILDELKNLCGADNVSRMRIQYGGSVKKDNIGEFVAAPEIHGALVGGASLQADGFAGLIKAAQEGQNG